MTKDQIENALLRRRRSLLLDIETAKAAGDDWGDGRAALGREEVDWIDSLIRRMRGR